MDPLARRTVAFVCVVLLLAVAAAAQTVTGTVLDISGGVIPAASITAVTSDGKSVTVMSDDAGKFATIVAAVRLTVKSEGFEEATIAVTGPGPINVVLRPVNFADSVVVMNGGRIVEQGLCEDVIGNPQQEYTARLIADTPSIEQSHLPLL